MGLIDDAKVKFLSDITYWITAPAMLFHAIANADVLSAFGSHLGVVAVAGVCSALTFVSIGGGLMRVRGGDLVVGAMSSSLNRFCRRPIMQIWEASIMRTRSLLWLSTIKVVPTFV